MKKHPFGILLIFISSVANAGGACANGGLTLKTPLGQVIEYICHINGKYYTEWRLKNTLPILREYQIATEDNNGIE